MFWLGPLVGSVAAALIWGWFFAPGLVTKKTKTKPTSKADSGKQATTAAVTATKSKTSRDPRIQADGPAGQTRRSKKRD